MVTLFTRRPPSEKDGLFTCGRCRAPVIPLWVLPARWKPVRSQLGVYDEQGKSRVFDIERCPKCRKLMKMVLRPLDT